MNTAGRTGWLALSAALALSVMGCDGPCCLVAPEDEDLTPEDLIALQTLEDQQTIQTAVSLVAEGPSSSPWQGMGRHAGQGESVQAREVRTLMEAARLALQRGDRTQAATQAREAHRIVAREVHRLRGASGVTAMVERMEDVALSVTLDPARLQDAEGLSLQLALLARTARRAMVQGDLSLAGALSTLGEQRIAQINGVGLAGGTGGSGGQGSSSAHGSGEGNGHTYQHRWRHGGTPENIEILISLSATAVELAAELIEEWGADADRLSYLEAAVEAQELAEAAFLAGDLREARYLAGLAFWQAWKAVLLPGEATAGQAQEILELATSLYDQARAAVETDPTELRSDLLARAAALIEKGESRLAVSDQGGLGALWRAAVICAWLIA